MGAAIDAKAKAHHVKKMAKDDLGAAIEARMRSNMKALDDMYKKKVARKKAAMKKAYLEKKAAAKASSSKTKMAPKKKSTRFVSKGKVLHPFDPKRRTVVLSHPTSHGIQNIADVMGRLLKKNKSKKKAVVYAPLKAQKMKATLVGTAAQKQSAKAASKEINIKAVHNAQKETWRNVKAAHRLHRKLHHAKSRAQAKHDWHHPNKQAKR